MKSPTDKTILPLHTHTTYSLMDGVSDIQQYVKYCSENGLEACSCTDHGYVLGLYDLITKTKDTSVKGIPGLEAYLAPHEGYRFNENLRKFDYFHLTLWAQNQVGYQNLLALSTASWGLGRVVKRFGQPKPRISWEDLDQYNDGIICGSGCIEGPIVKPYLRGEKDMASYNLELLMDLFGKRDRLFMEVMPHSVDRDWESKGVIQVEGENGIKYTFKDTDKLETDFGVITAKQACEKRIEEIYSSITNRPQDFPISNRNIDPQFEIIDEDAETPTKTFTRNIIHEG
jgi:DNA polymerase-3 subunit alpha